jgi:hypothetical protein
MALRPLFPVAAVIRNLAGGVRDVNEACVIGRLFEQRHCRTHECVELAHRVLELEPVPGGDDTGESLTRGVGGSRRFLGCALGDRSRLTRVASESLSEIDLEVGVETQRPGEVERPLEQGPRSMVVAARARAAAGRGKPCGCAFGKKSVRLLELSLVAGGLLEVVAQDLVELDQVRASLFEPAGEALV